MENSENTPAWKALRKHSEWFKREDFHLGDLVSNDTNRFQNNSIIHEGLLFDYSKNYLNQDTLPLLVDLAQQRQVPAAIEAMFCGENINSTEKRAALHVALRDPAASNQYPEVGEALAKVEALVAAVHSGKWQGYTGLAITDVVNIGIGGSDLGPAMVCDALSASASKEIKVHFVSNIDPSHLQNILQQLRPATTLFIVASKSFSTLETLNNAKSAQQWLLQEAKSPAATTKHFVAITTNSAAALQFGIEEKNLFPLWDWVGGRFSLWSTIGLPIALLLGMNGFRQLLAGAHSMDKHFRTAKLSENIPVISALLGFWYREYFDAHSSATIPYSQRLNLLPSFLQQLCMESLGKSTNNQGETVGYKTGEVIWGSAGTNGQHSYFQLFHQGTEFIPVEFIAMANAADSENAESQQHLLANCFSQSLALMNGKTNDKFPYKHVQGNKPSSTILLEELNAYNLGKLLALYEHKVYVLSAIWNINAFDQWGVELGKELSQQLFAAISNPANPSDLDNSTQGLIQQSKSWERKQL